MGEVTFILFRKLLATILVLALIWPDVARCMQEEDVSQQKNSSLPVRLLQKISTDQKENLPSTDEKQPLSSIVLKEGNPTSEDPNLSFKQEILLSKETKDPLSEKNKFL
jgi:hypothetical protein